MLGWILGMVDDLDSQPDIEEIYTKYKRLMYATAGKFTKNVEDQKDIVQTGMERLIRIFSVPTARKRCISAGYIVFTIRSVAIDFLRKQSRDEGKRISLDDDQLSEISSTDRALEKLLQSSEDAQQLWQLWPRLSAEDRILLEGKYILDYSDEELAFILECKPGSVRMKLTRARRRAAKLLPERD